MKSWLFPEYVIWARVILLLISLFVPFLMFINLFLSIIQNKVIPASTQTKAAIKNQLKSKNLVLNNESPYIVNIHK